ncbi:MAG TPA: helix-turn-helix transcriptional regulator, partial [Clostridia bacterium]|nr:helix-turn-helix transcriptional regulator [Clostridia bacterium]
MKPLNDIIAENLTALRKANGFTQIELAEKLNYSDKSVSKWERGETVPSVEVLTEMARLYAVTLDYMVCEHADETIKYEHETKVSYNNKIIVTLLAILVIWLLAITVYLYVNMIYKVNLWIVYIWAVPASTIVGLVFNCIWGKARDRFVIMSILVWTLLASIYLQFLEYNLWGIFVLGVPLQIAIILWSKIKP